MSYDYSLFKAPGPGPMSSWAPTSPTPLGTLADVQQQLTALFPQVSWQSFGKTCFGRPHPASMDGGMEFQITPDDDGLCRFLTVRRIARPEIEELCRALGVVAVDDQKIELIRPPEV
jgi:hypothetical protein